MYYRRFLCLPIVIALVSGCRGKPPEKGLARIRENYGIVKEDLTRPDHPVISVLAQRGDGNPTDDDLEDFQRLTSLEKLMLEGPIQITDRGMGYLRPLVNLKELCIIGAFTDRGLQSIEGMHDLRKLNIWSMHITDEALSHVKDLTQLRELSVSYITGSGLKYLKDLRNLKSLSLEYRGTPAVDFGELQTLKELDGLTLGNFAGSRFKGLKELKGLRSLSINHGTISADAFQDIHELKQLRDLSLWDIQITGGGAGYFNGMVSLEEIKIRKVSLSDLALGDLSGFVRLQSLSLVGTAITGNAIRSLKPLPNLTTLIVTDPVNLADTDLAAFEQKFPNLKRLEIHSPLITDQGLAHLGRLSKLESFDLSGCPQTTAEGMGLLRSRLRPSP